MIRYLGSIKIFFVVLILIFTGRIIAQEDIIETPVPATSPSSSQISASSTPAFVASDRYLVSIIAPTNVTPVKTFDSHTGNYDIDTVSIHVRVQALTEVPDINLIRLEIFGDIPQAPIEILEPEFDEENIIVLTWDISSYNEVNESYDVDLVVSVIDESGRISQTSQRATLDIIELQSSTQTFFNFERLNAPNLIILVLVISVITLLFWVGYLSLSSEKSQQAQSGLQNMSQFAATAIEAVTSFVVEDDEKNTINHESGADEYAMLYVEKGLDNIASIKVTKSEFILGRDRNLCDYRIDNDKVSRAHCTIYYENGRFRIMDLTSDNGTTVAGREIVSNEKHDLKYGDKIVLGKRVHLRLQQLISSSTELVIDGGDTGFGFGNNNDRLSHDKVVYAELQVTKGADVSFIPITHKRFVIGRAKEAGCDYAIPHKSVSARHVEFGITQGIFYIKDIGSTYGTFVNDMEIGKHVEVPITTGAEISLARSVFMRFEQLVEIARIDAVPTAWNSSGAMEYQTLDDVEDNPQQPTIRKSPKSSAFLNPVGSGNSIPRDESITDLDPLDDEKSSFINDRSNKGQSKINNTEFEIPDDIDLDDLI
ncbi:MAG: hypothetical protein Phog2KO_47970 [Phototrophicaceae bacterium]